MSVFPSPNRSLRLPVRDSPDLPWETDLSKWAGPHRFGGSPDDDVDDTAALQAAIDSGATTIYLPNGQWTLNGEVEVRGEVVRLLGAEAKLETTNGVGRILVKDGAADTVVIERLESGLNNQSVEIQQDTARTLVLNSLLNFGFETHPDATDPGQLFLNDFGGEVAFRDQEVWARQLNVESATEQDPGEPAPDRPARIVNDGGRVWLSGVKTEQDGTVVLTINGGETELLGTFHAGSGDTQVDPRFETIDSSFSAAVWVDQVGGSGRFDVFARETRDGVTRTVTLPASGPFPNLYTAFAFTDAVDQPELWLRGDGDAVDASGFGHYAFPSPAVAFTGDSVDQAGSFDFSGDGHVEISTGFLQQVLGERTVSMFIKPRDLDGLQTLFDEGGRDGGLTLLMSDATLAAAATDGTQAGSAQGGQLNADQWAHVAFTYDHGELVVYVDGERVGDAVTPAATIPWHPDDRSALGGRLDGSAIESTGSAASGFDGLIDDFRVWGVALSDQQILALSQSLPAVLGDLDGDGDVDVVDLDLFGASLLSGGSDLTGDLDGDGDVDVVDLDLFGSELLKNGGSRSASMSRIIPEPSTALVAAVGLLMLSGRQHHASAVRFRRWPAS